MDALLLRNLKILMLTRRAAAHVQVVSHTQMVIIKLNRRWHPQHSLALTVGLANRY